MRSRGEQQVLGIFSLNNPEHNVWQIQCKKWAVIPPDISMDTYRMYPRKNIYKPSGTSKSQRVVNLGCASRWLPKGGKIYCLVKIFNRWAAHLYSFAKSLILKSLTLVLISFSSTEFSRNTLHLKAASKLTSWEAETRFICVSCISYRMKVIQLIHWECVGRILSLILYVEEGLSYLHSRAGRYHQLLDTISYRYLPGLLKQTHPSSK